MRKILIVEDDSEINKLLADFLQSNGYETVCADDGQKAIMLMKKQDFCLVIMDLMLPYRNGEQLIKEFREYSQIPVIVLSAKSMMETRLAVLRLGADDYILKPFDLNEVLVRIEVVLRRSGTDKQLSDGVLSCGELCLKTAENTVTYRQKQIALTAKEFMLLKLFMEYPQKVYSKANLYESVWNDTYYYEDNTINVHVSNLRNKLKKATENDYIETVWGIGYRLKGEL